MRNRSVWVVAAELALVSVLTLVSGAGAAEMPLYPWIEELEGITKVTLQASDGKSREAGLGDAWGPIETIEMPVGGYARIAFPDGTQVLLTPGARVRWEGEKPFAVVLLAGEARVLVEKAKSEAGLKFIAKTPGSVLGVRGTDFLVGWKEPVTEVHAFSGLVALAKEEAELRQGLAVPVRAGERLAQPKDAPYEAPIAFDQSDALKDLDERHPGLRRLWQSAVRSARSGELVRKARKVRSVQQRFAAEAAAAEAKARPAPSPSTEVSPASTPKEAEPLKMKRKSRRHWRRHR